MSKSIIPTQLTAVLDSDLLPLYVLFVFLILAATLVLVSRRKGNGDYLRAMKQESDGVGAWVKVDVVRKEGMKTTTFVYGSFGEGEGV